MTTEKITIEAESINEAMNIGAEQLQVDVSHVSYEIDRSHFRTNEGKSVGKETIKVFVSIKSADSIKSSKERNSTGDSKRDNRQREKIESEAGTWATTFLHELIEKMGIEAKINYMIKDRSREHVITLQVKSNQGGRLVGRRGSSLRKIKYILDMVRVKLYPNCEFFIDILSEDGKRRNENERNRRHDKRNKYSNRKPKLGDREIEKMKKMARKVGSKVATDQKAVVITKLLNNFERKIIHEVISEMDNVATESFNDSEGIRRIRIYPISDITEYTSSEESFSAPTVDEQGSVPEEQENKDVQSSQDEE